MEIDAAVLEWRPSLAPESFRSLADPLRLVSPTFVLVTIHPLV